MKALLITIFICISCTNKNQDNSSEIKFNNRFPLYLNYSNYDFLIQKYDNLAMQLQWVSGVNFDSKNDTVFMSYIVSCEKFINSGKPDSIDYAGYFLQKNIINNQVILKIKNYRYSGDETAENDFKYTDVKLTFSKNFDTLYWKLLESSPYLLDEDTIILKK